MSGNERSLRAACGVGRGHRSVIVDGVRLAYEDSGADNAERADSTARADDDADRLEHADDADRFERAADADRSALADHADRPPLVCHADRSAFADHADRPPLVCLHAVGHGAGDSAAFRARHAHHFRTLALDWPGHGRSDADSAPPSAARYAALLAGLLDALALPPAVLIGNSIGGAAAVRLAAARPDRVRALVLCNPGGFTRPSFVKRAYTRALAWIFARGAGRARWFPRFWRAFCARVLATPAAAEQRDRIIAAGPEMAPLLRDAWRNFAAPDDALHPLLPSLACPVLVTWSLGDPVNPLFVNRGAIRLFRDGRLHTFAGGHAPFLEVPDAFDAVFATFIQELRL